MANDTILTTESLKHILPVFEDSILEKAKYELPKTLEPLHNDIPTIFITGMIPDSKDYVKGELEYVSKTDSFKAYTYIKLQGNSTLALPKKNFTIKLYKDENHAIALNKDFKNWGAHNNFVIKADYNDILRARNVVCAKLWGKIVASRSDYDTLPEELRNSPNNGAIDGFPVKVYLNGEYYGLCNWTIPKCDWQFGMNKNNENHAVLCAEINDNGYEDGSQINPCNFNIFIDDSNWDAWSTEVGNDEIAKEAFNNVISRVINNYDNGEDEFNKLEGVLDVNSAIDYLIFQEVILGIDGLAKNMLCVTYDLKKWFLTPYDMDSTFDMHWGGYLMDYFYAEIGTEPYLNHYSRLWECIWNNYWDVYVERYTELRKTVLSHASIMSEFENYIGIYGEDLYIKDTVAFSEIPEATTNTLAYLNTFVKNRLEFLDEYNEVTI